jgi:kojibiose phosphorylase
MQPKPSGSGINSSELLLEPTTDPTWLWCEEGFTLAREHEVESLCSIANGYIGSRGFPEGETSLSDPATFVAGVFIDNAANIPQLAVLPHWMNSYARIDGNELRPELGDILEHRRILDLRQGVLWRVWRQRQANGRITRILGLQFASLADRHLLLQSILMVPENYSALCVVDSGTAEVPESDRTAGETFSLADQDGRPVLTAVLPTRNGEIVVSYAFALTVSMQGQIWKQHTIDLHTGQYLQEIEVPVEIGNAYRMDRILSVYTTRDIHDPTSTAVRNLNLAAQTGVEKQLKAHVQRWQSRWRDADIVIEGDDAVQRALRFAAYHLISAANSEDERVSVGARALTGRGYGGHVFWDTEIFLLPFYLLTHPPSARALLQYRFHNLPAARENAKAKGYAGALFPWESAADGEEVTPPSALGPGGKVIPILNGEQEHHINADVAYAVWQYWQATGDEEFLINSGAEILIETARFWASRGRVEGDGRFHIRNVIGPDEYHENVDDNVYTNLMAQWNLSTAEKAVQFLYDRWPAIAPEIDRRLALTAEEVQEWSHLAAITYTGLSGEANVFEQFDGYFTLADINLAAYEPRTVAMDLLLGHDRIQQSKIVKQADVVMALYLLWNDIPLRIREANFRYYEPRTAHGSSLSPPIHALMAARLGDVDMAERYLRETMDIDLADNMGNAAGGVHIAALGGLWQAVVFGFAGVQLREDGVIVDPHLPSRWNRLRIPLLWRNRKVQLDVVRQPLSIQVEFEGEDGLRLQVAGGPEVMMQASKKYRSHKFNASWSDWLEVGV